jgi:hypothetical protein
MVSESGELALDAAVSPARVLLCQADDQLTKLAVEARATGRVRVDPFLGHGRNAKLQLTVLLAPEEPVDGLYLHPEHRRRARRADARMGMDVQ